MADATLDPPKDKVKKKKSVKKSDAPPKDLLEAPGGDAAPAGDASAPDDAAKAPKEKKVKSRKTSAVPPTTDAAPGEEPASEAAPEAAPEAAEAAGDPEAAPDVADGEPTPVAQEERAEPAVEPVVAAPQPQPQPQVQPKRKKSEKRNAAGEPEMCLEDLDEEKLIELKEAFELFDLDGDGMIDLADLRLTFASLGKADVSDEELSNMLAEGSNPMDFDSFVMLLGFKTIALDPEETLRMALSAWDYRDSGLINEERIKHDLMTWGDRFDTAEAEGAFEDAPAFITNGERMIDYIKFCKTLGGLRKKPDYED